MPPAAPEPLLGSVPWVSVLCKFADIPAEPQPLSYFQNMFANQYPLLDHYWRAVSYGHMNLAGSTAVGWYTLPQPRAYYVYYDELNGRLITDMNRLWADCTAAADADVYYPDYYGINLMFNGDLAGNPIPSRGPRNLDGVEQVWAANWTPPNAWSNLSVMAYLMGWNFGLLPSRSANNAVNVWDVVDGYWFNSAANSDPLYGCVGQHTIAGYKELLGWLAPSQVYTVAPGETATITVERLALPTNDNPLLVKVPIQGSDQIYYTVEVRRQVGYDSKLPGEAVIIHLFNNDRAQIIDIDGNDNTGDAGAMWLPGETFLDAAAGVTITVEAAIGAGFRVTAQTAELQPFACGAQSQIPTGECQALVALYEATNGPHWNNHAGWLEVPSPCLWFGVSCENGHVVQLSMNNNNLAGPLPAEIGDLPALTDLLIAGDSLSGPLPPELGNLTNLETLYLPNNFLTGSLPPEMGGMQALEQLILANNQLSGSLPPQLADLDQLVYLDVSHNQLDGPLPSEIGGLAHLQFLYAYDNQLSGSLPASLGALTTLRNLSLQNNLFTGGIPPQLGDLLNLEFLDLRNNPISGEIPPELGSLATLQFLLLSNMNLSGPLPPELGNLSNLAGCGPRTTP